MATTRKTSTVEVAKKVGKALENEAKANADLVEITLTIRGDEVTVLAPPNVEAANWRVPLLMQEGTNQSIAKAIPLILGDEGCAKLDAHGASFNDLNTFLELWSEEIGMGE